LLLFFIFTFSSCLPSVSSDPLFLFMSSWSVSPDPFLPFFLLLRLPLIILVLLLLLIFGVLAQRQCVHNANEITPHFVLSKLNSFWISGQRSKRLAWYKKNSVPLHKNPYRTHWCIGKFPSLYSEVPGANFARFHVTPSRSALEYSQRPIQCSSGALFTKKVTANAENWRAYIMPSPSIFHNVKHRHRYDILHL
jgi:hypothetical protein